LLALPNLDRPLDDFESWQALKTGLPTMSDHADTISSKAVISGAEPQLFVGDISPGSRIRARNRGF
jgi:hypothetical protein